MPIKINKPTIIEAAGSKPKIIEEYFGRVNSDSNDVSIARMKSPAGWVEPGQRPEFDEYTVVLSGELNVKTEDENIIIVKAGEAILTKKSEWIQYSTPKEETEYIAICHPAFSPETVHRDE
ncbi:MAG TPA: cupin [Ignavibacteria bacterium]|nr:cupin [Ignavibacteria bacterium]